ncbi:MAG: DUF3822 family protein [Phocaeicola sp.]
MTSRIDLTQSEHYTLSIRLSADGFSFSIYSPQDKEILFRRFSTNEAYSMTANIKEWLIEAKELEAKFKKVNVLVDSNRFTTVPFDLFDDEQVDALFYYNHTPLSNEIVMCNVLGTNNVVLLFGMDKYAHQLLNEKFPMAHFYASMSSLTELFRQHQKSHPKPTLYLYLCEHKIEAYAFVENQLQLQNTYACQQASDRIYYTLAVWQQLQFSQEEDCLYLLGNERVQEEMCVEVKKYIRNVTLLSSLDFFNEVENRSQEIPLDLVAMLCYEKEYKNK